MFFIPLSFFSPTSSTLRKPLSIQCPFLTSCVQSQQKHYYQFLMMPLGSMLATFSSFLSCLPLSLIHFLPYFVFSFPCANLPSLFPYSSLCPSSSLLSSLAHSSFSSISFWLSLLRRGWSTWEAGRKPERCSSNTKGIWCPEEVKGLFLCWVFLAVIIFITQDWPDINVLYTFFFWSLSSLIICFKHLLSLASCSYFSPIPIPLYPGNICYIKQEDYI